MCSTRIPIYPGDSFEMFYEHIRQNHRYDVNFEVSCCLPGCQRLNDNFNSFKRHWNKCLRMNIVQQQQEDEIGKLFCYNFKLSV